MSEPEIAQDTVVETALRLLPVPPHGDDFWARLDRAIDADGSPTEAVASTFPALGSAPAVAAAPYDVAALERDPSLALVPGTLRRTSNALLVAVAAAAIVVVAVAGNSLLEERSGDEPVASEGQPEPDRQLDALVEDAQTGAAARRPLTADGQDASTAAVLAWVEDMSSGDADDAWAALGSASQGFFGSESAFEEEMATLADGYRMWSGTEPDQILVTAISSSDEGTLAVVTLVGTVTVDGEEERRADAFPVRVIGDDAHLEPFASAGPLEVVVPEGPPDADHDELLVVVPSGSEAPLLRLDDGDTLECGRAEGTELTELEGTSGQRCSYLPAGGIDAGQHTLTVAFLSSEGTEITAKSLLFEAA